MMMVTRIIRTNSPSPRHINNAKIPYMHRIYLYLRYNPSENWWGTSFEVGIYLTPMTGLL